MIAMERKKVPVTRDSSEKVNFYVSSILQKKTKSSHCTTQRSNPSWIPENLWKKRSNQGKWNSKNRKFFMRLGLWLKNPIKNGGVSIQTVPRRMNRFIPYSKRPQSGGSNEPCKVVVAKLLSQKYMEPVTNGVKTAMKIKRVVIVQTRVLFQHSMTWVGGINDQVGAWVIKLINDVFQYICLNWLLLSCNNRFHESECGPGLANIKMRNIMLGNYSSPNSDFFGIKNTFIIVVNEG